jgi:HD-GYP domain-containing protein (c-di-GMP phosphodiesterase class II)|tara:strand:+ start:671 stop:838 length:168 start_codon:yes stop_codon:yes gene_type:complete
MLPREDVRRLRNIDYGNERMLELITCHHENYDGSGYPTEIKAENILAGARILAVA